MNMAGLSGIIPIIPTPFEADEGVAWPVLRRFVEFACRSGAAAICLPAYASEFYKLSEDERERAVSEAVEQAAKRLPVIGQVNTAGARLAMESIERLESCGVDGICIAVPRMFALQESDIERYLSRALFRAKVPVIIQDFHPSGGTISAGLIKRISQNHAQLQFVKLEEPMLADKIGMIREQTDGHVGVLLGWGGMYLLELLPAGIAGAMPGLAISDILGLVWRRYQQGDCNEAYRVFRDVLPQIVFSLRTMEFFHCAEKSLLMARGLTDNVCVREATVKISAADAQHLGLLNAQILDALARFQIPKNPL